MLPLDITCWTCKNFNGTKFHLMFIRIISSDYEHFVQVCANYNFRRYRPINMLFSGIINKLGNNFTSDGFVECYIQAVGLWSDRQPPNCSGLPQPIFRQAILLCDVRVLGPYAQCFQPCPLIIFPMGLSLFSTRCNTWTMKLLTVHGTQTWHRFYTDVSACYRSRPTKFAVPSPSPFFINSTTVWEPELDHLLFIGCLTFLYAFKKGTK